MVGGSFEALQVPCNLLWGSGLHKPTAKRRRGAEHVLAQQGGSKGQGGTAIEAADECASLSPPPCFASGLAAIFSPVCFTQAPSGSLGAEILPVPA